MRHKTSGYVAILKSDFNYHNSSKYVKSKSHIIKVQLLRSLEIGVYVKVSHYLGVRSRALSPLFMSK